MYNTLTLLGKKIKAAWTKMFEADASSELLNTLVETVNSDKDKESYSFTYLFTKIREWIDEAVFETGKTFEYIIKNKKWQAGFLVDVDTINDIKADSVLNSDLQMSIKGIANDFTQHKEELLDDALVANGNAFDNAAFFANSRSSIPDGTDLDNIVSGTGATIALIAADIASAMQQLDAMKIKGKPLNKGAKFIAIVPTHLWMIFNKLATVEKYYNGVTDVDNDLKGTFTVIKNYSQATTNNDWYMTNSSAKMKALIMQKRQEPEMKEIPDDGKDNLKYNWKARYAVGYGSPFAIVWINNS